jgi:TolB-like protein
MIKRVFLVLLLIVLLCGSYYPLQAGQVVTDDIRAWAQMALEQEKDLDAERLHNTLAVLSFQNKSGKAKLNQLQKGLAFMLMTDLSQVEGLQLVERVKLQALVEEMDLGVSGLVDPDTAPRVGRLLGARFLVGGDIQGTAIKLGIASDVLEVPQERVAGRPSSEGELEKIFEMEKELLFAIIDILKVELTPEKKLELEKPLTRDIEALFNLMDAIDSSDRGNYLKAEAYYKEALKKDPGLSAAQEGLDELSSLNLVGPNDRSRAMTSSLDDKTSQTSSLFDDSISRRKRDPHTISIGQIRVRW